MKFLILEYNTHAIYMEKGCRSRVVLAYLMRTHKEKGHRKNTNSKFWVDALRYVAQ